MQKRLKILFSILLGAGLSSVVAGFIVDNLGLIFGGIIFSGLALNGLYANKKR
jgi:hypothetical protein